MKLLDILGVEVGEEIASKVESIATEYEGFIGYCQAQSVLQVDKNEYISELFSGTDGRISLTADTSENLSDAERLKKLIEILENEVFWHRGRARFLDLDSNSIEAKIIRSLTGLAINLEVTLKGIDKNGKVVADTNVNGMKIGKFLNQSLLFSQVGSEEDFKEIEKILGGIVSPDRLSYGKQEKEIIMSIRPDDFYSMSIGNSWSSCQAPDGEYHAGAMACATGEDSVIFFVKSKDSFVVKEWRVMGALKEDGLAFSVQYPEYKEGYLDGIAKALSKVVEQDYLVNDECYVSVIETGEAGYLDFVHQTSETKVYTTTKSSKRIAIEMQKFGFCEECSCENTRIYGDTNRCEDCDDKVFCERCGEYCDEDDVIEVYSSRHSASYYCKDCIDSDCDFIFSDEENCYVDISSCYGVAPVYEELDSDEEEEDIDYSERDIIDYEFTR